LISVFVFCQWEEVQGTRCKMKFGVCGAAFDNNK